MTSELFTEILRSTAVLSMFLLIGTVLRAKVKAFQRVFLPASVIGGFLALLTGPILWGDKSPLGLLGVNMDWVNIWSLIPGILIVPIFAAVPLGMFTNKEEDDGSEAEQPRNKMGYILISCGLYMGVSTFQIVIGYLINIIYSKFNPGSVYRTFGYELSAGFAGGHGTAGAVGKLFEGWGIDYWQTAQGITSTTATIGLVGGMILGILFINRAAKAGKTAILDNPEDVPMDLKQGFTKNVEEQKSLGRETVYGSAIETITIHLALILTGVGLGYYLRNIMMKTGIESFTSLPIWTYAMFSMLFLDYILAKLKLNWLIDSNVKARITGTLSDFAIISAMASVPVQALMEYIVPILIMCFIGFIATYIIVFKGYGHFFSDNAPFEHAIIAWGASTGVMINGLMLLKIADPDYETPALVNFSLGFTLKGLIGLVTGLITIPILRYGSTMDNLLVNIGMFIFTMVLAFSGKWLINSNKKTA